MCISTTLYISFHLTSGPWRWTGRGHEISLSLFPMQPHRINHSQLFIFNLTSLTDFSGTGIQTWLLGLQNVTPSLVTFLYNSSGSAENTDMWHSSVKRMKKKLRGWSRPWNMYWTQWQLRKRCIYLQAKTVQIYMSHVMITRCHLFATGSQY